MLRPIARPSTVPATIEIASPCAQAISVTLVASRKAGSTITFGIAITTPVGFAT